MQLAAANLYAWLDEWADGATLRDFARRMENAPEEQVAAMVRQWPVPDVPPLEVLRPGQLRPVVNFGDRSVKSFGTALRLLLYIDEVVVSTDVLDPFRSVPRLQVGSVDRSAQPAAAVRAEDLAAQIRLLGTLRPLVAEGFLRFSPWKHPQQLRDTMAMLASAWPDLDWDLNDDGYLTTVPRRWLENVVANEMDLVVHRHATALSLRRRYDIGELMREMSAATRLDRRRAPVELLAELTVPDFSDDARDLVALRLNSDRLAGFRDSLSEAFVSVSDLPDTDTARRDAASIVADILRSRLAGVEREAKSASVRAVPKDVARRLGFVGVGAVAGTAVMGALGSPLLGGLTGLASGAATALSEGVRDAFTRLQERKSARAVMNVVTAFEPELSERPR